MCTEEVSRFMSTDKGEMSPTRDDISVAVILVLPCVTFTATYCPTLAPEKRGVNEKLSVLFIYGNDYFIIAVIEIV